MIKYYDWGVVFQEIPDEITLTLEITNCPHLCDECHSPWLRSDIGTILNEVSLAELIMKNPHITCICFMGGDADHKSIVRLAQWLHQYTDLKVAMYSGDTELDNQLIEVLDYYKIGPYIKELGPLNSKTTNQRLYYIKNKELIDITYKFQK